MPPMYVQYEKMLGHLETVGIRNRADTEDGKRYELNGRNVTFYWRDRQAIAGPKESDTWPLPESWEWFGHVDCCGAIFSAFYLEYARQIAVDLSLEANRALRPSWNAYATWMPFGDLADGPIKRQASTYALGEYFDAGYRLTDLTEVRRGDLFQIWWYGEDGSDQSWSGHNVLVWDSVIDATGLTRFQYASAQKATTKSGLPNTDGIGVGETALERFDSTQDFATQVASISKSFIGVTNPPRSGYSARFNRAFPYYPVGLAEAAETVGFEQGGLLVEGGALPGYYINNEGGPGGLRDGGTFPIGRHRTWHGGVHLYAGTGQPVHAIADGVIVAARMDPADEALDAAREASPDVALPNRNFVLIQHRAKIDGADQVFYSLYAHLDPEEDEEALFKARWLWKIRTISHLDGHRKLLGHGGVARLAMPVAAGDIIGHVAATESGSPFVHVSILSAGGAPITTFEGGETIDDTDNDIFADAERMLELLFDKVDTYGNKIGDFFGFQDGVLRPGEIENFYATPNATQLPIRDAFRRFVVRYKSEWSTDLSWTDIGDTERFGYSSQADLDALAEAFALYGFLDGPVAQHARLPADGKIWHYHPITFLWWLRTKFYDGTATQEAQGVADFVTGHVADLVAGGQLPEPVTTGPGSEWIVNQNAAVMRNKHDLAVFDGTAAAPGALRAGVRATEPFVQAGAAPVNAANGTFLSIEHASGQPTWICISSAGVNYAVPA